MSLTQLLVQTAVTFVAASLGALFGALLIRRTERFKHLQELQSAAYVDFLRGFARVGRAQRDSPRNERSVIEELEGRAIVTDSRSRIAVYGSRGVVLALSKFISLGTETLSPAGRQAFAELCALMRMEAVKQVAPLEDVRTVLYG